MRILVENEIKRPGLVHFIKKEFLSTFLDGRLSLAHGPSFRKGGKDPGGRIDEDEGFISIGNSSNTRIWLGLEKTPGVAVPLSDCHELTSLVGKQRLQTGDDAQIHILCFTTIDLDQITKQIDARMAHDRDYILVIVNPKKFFERFDKAIIESGLGMKRDFVEYIDDNEKRQKEVFFAKTLEYSYQKEFRIAVFGHPTTDRLTLCLGDLRDVIRAQNLKTGEIEKI